MSFCIPFYNKAEIAAKIVHGILVSDDPRFEVILCDDASKENAQELLSQIHDERFRYIRNAKNLGAHRNWLKALESGRGEWLYFVIGRDRINGEHITRLIELLDYAGKNGITFLLDGYPHKQELVVYPGIEAMIQFISGHHPTGSIFSRKVFEEIPDREYYFTHSDMYPENYLRRDMLLHGKGASIRSYVFVHYSSLVDRTNVKSTVEHDMNLYDMYYAPRRRTLQFFEDLDMVAVDCADKFTAQEIDKYFSSKFVELLGFVSDLWRAICRNSEWQAHYGQKVTHIGLAEMVRNIFKAYSDTKAHLLEKGMFSSMRQRIMYRTVFRTLVKTTAKAALEPLGIWRLLKAIKRGICTKRACR
ncbi:MAG: glycosyltransferase family 2 protein [Synergistaceae bacterium]|nr:glycosyltransferase family 2 protein [Synergistaceae bacterium]